MILLVLLNCFQDVIIIDSIIELLNCFQDVIIDNIGILDYIISLALALQLLK